MRRLRRVKLKVKLKLHECPLCLLLSIRFFFTDIEHWTCCTFHFIHDFEDRKEVIRILTEHGAKRRGMDFLSFGTEILKENAFIMIG